MRETRETQHNAPFLQDMTKTQQKENIINSLGIIISIFVYLNMSRVFLRADLPFTPGLSNA